MIYNAYITSGTLKPTNVLSKHPYAYIIRIGAAIEIAGSIILGLSRADIVVGVSIIIAGIIVGVCIDALGEFLTMMKTMVNQEYELHNVTMQIETDEIMPVSIVENGEYIEDETDEIIEDEDN